MERYRALSASDTGLNQYHLMEGEMEDAKRTSRVPEWKKSPAERQFYLSNPNYGREPIPEHIPEHHEGRSLTCRRICCCPLVIPFFIIGTAGGAVLGILTAFKNLAGVIATSFKCPLCILCTLIIAVPALLILPIEIVCCLAYGISTGGCKLVAKAMGTSINFKECPSLMKMFDQWLERTNENFENRRAQRELIV
ncbi:hypothetical protein [Kistimonas scapharcae]|uniref:hypothetical protein n=1 Tax=Kistimonas scapharcae TaxID=1036133 RepID=UPI0031EE68BC